MWYRYAKFVYNNCFFDIVDLWKYRCCSSTETVAYSYTSTQTITSGQQNLNLINFTVSPYTYSSFEFENVEIIKNANGIWYGLKSNPNQQATFRNVKAKYISNDDTAGIGIVNISDSEIVYSAQRGSKVSYHNVNFIGGGNEPFALKTVHLGAGASYKVELVVSACTFTGYQKWITEDLNAQSYVFIDKSEFKDISNVLVETKYNTNANYNYSFNQCLFNNVASFIPMMSMFLFSLTLRFEFK